MNKLVIRLNPQQRANLLELLKRCPLKGAEVKAVNEIITAIETAKPEPENTP